MDDSRDGEITETTDAAASLGHITLGPGSMAAVAPHDPRVYADARGPAIPTRSGRLFPLLHPKPEDVDVRDIAAGLANQGRFAGQGHPYYSVAEHCIAVSRLVPEAYALRALLHDAHEAYMGDITAPMKAALRYLAGGSDLVALIAGGIDAAIFTHFGLAVVPESDAEAAAIRAADDEALRVELGGLFGRVPEEIWQALGRSRRAMAPPLPPAEAELAWLGRLRTLTGKRAGAGA